MDEEKKFQAGKNPLGSWFPLAIPPVWKKGVE